MKSINTNVATVFAIAVAIVLGGCSLQSADKTPVAPLHIQPLQERMDMAEAGRGTIQTSLRGNAVFVSGNVLSLSYQDSSGRLKAVHAELGKEVAAGELLAELETDELEQQLQLQKLQAERAQLNYREAVLGEAGEIVELSRRIDLERERAALQAIEDKIGNARLYAPIDGVVTFVGAFRPGDQIGAYQTVAMLSDPDSLMLQYTASQPASLIALEAGMEAVIQFQGSEYSGKVLQSPSGIPQRTDPQKRAKNIVRIYLALEELPPNARIGNSADIAITLQQRDNVIIIPRSAVRSFMGREYVLVMDGDRRKQLDVETGLASGTDIEIVKGLEEGQLVVISN